MNIYKKIRNLSLDYEMETAELLAEMVKIPSYSTKEKQMAAFIQTKMEAYGFDEVRLDALGSIIGRIGSGTRLIAFDAHIDTVYPGNLTNWNFPPHAGLIKGGRVWGRGAADQLGGMAAMLISAKMIKDLNLNNYFTILFTGTVMEEDCDGIAWDHLINEEGIRPELVVSTEPTSLNLYRGQRGRMEIRLEVKGISCHGSAPERGDNAIYKISKIALEIEKLNYRLVSDPFLGKGTVTATIINSDSPSQCAVADYAMLQLDRRLTKNETRETVIAELKQCCEVAGERDAKIKILHYDESAYTGKVYPIEKFYPFWVLEADSPYLHTATQAYENTLNRRPNIGKWTFSTNCVSIMGKHPEIKCIGMGPGDEIEAHAPNESIKISDLSAASSFYAALVAKLNEEEVKK
jgi:putative selenium metabolism hydrolase